MNRTQATDERSRKRAGGPSAVRRSGSDTRREIVENALQLFSVKGYHTRSAAELGMSRVWVYAESRNNEDTRAAIDDVRASDLGVERGELVEGVHAGLNKE